MKSIYQFILFTTILSVTATSCKKQLEKRPNSNVLVPKTPTQMHGLLDNPEVFGYGHTLGLLSADEFYFTPAYYKLLTETMKNLYTWQNYPFNATETDYDYKRIYQQVLYANVVLERLNELSASTDRELALIKGDALFKRALAFNMSLELYTFAYDAGSATTDMGIPLKLTSNNNVLITRSSVQECYDQMLSDLNVAKDLLQLRPDPLHRNRASGIAVAALMARISLCMGKWQEAALQAATVLQGCDSLINYNTINSAIEVPFPGDNREVIYPLKAPDNNIENALVAPLAGAGANVDSNLIGLYEPNDLRLKLYFKPHQKTYGLKTSLTGIYVPFEGISMSEVYLILAESNARLNKPDTALFYLEKLLRARYKTGANLNLPDSQQPDSVLDRILLERKKELAFRGQRWSDIKRLNKLNGNIIQQRVVDNKTYTMQVNDLRYALLLPESTVQNNNLEQNKR